MYIHHEINDDVNPIEKKIEVLQDFCILNPRSKTQEKAVRDILANCRSEAQWTRNFIMCLEVPKRLKNLLQDIICRQYGNANLRLPKGSLF